MQVLHGLGVWSAGHDYLPVLPFAALPFLLALLFLGGVRSGASRELVGRAVERS